MATLDEPIAPASPGLDPEATPPGAAAVEAAVRPALRPARPEDAAALNEIYNHYVRTSASTFDLEEHPLEAREAWLAGFAETGRHRLLVAVEEERLVAWACSRQFRTKAAYDPSVETSVYCAPDVQGRGIGRILYAGLFEALAGEDVHRAYAGVTLPNPASVRLHEAFGFAPIARFSEVGRKFGRYWDVQWFEKRLPGA